MVDDVARGQIRVDAVWDIETEGWDTFVVGALWTAEDGTIVYHDEDELGAALLSLPAGSVAWAHSGGRFDVLWLLDWCHRRGHHPPAQIRMSGATITALSINQGPELRDSYRLIPMGLAKACRIFAGGVEKQELSLPCSCGRPKCQGYCSIRRKMPRALMERLKAYLVADVEALRDTLRGLVDYCAVNDLVLSGTVASSSWRSAKLMCHLPDTDWELADYSLARSGYFGGKCAVGRTEAKRIARYDRSAAYPAALMGPVPCGKLKRVDGRSAKTALRKRRPGFYSATVDVPESMSPVLPIRVANRIAYPWGTIAGTWPLEELEYAVDQGAKITAVGESIVWDTAEPLLRPYVEHVWRLRDGAATKELGQWLKWLANSLTGAFAQDPESELIAIGDYADDSRWSTVGVHDWLWRRTIFRIADRAHIHWSGTLTGRARVELDRQIEHAGAAWCYSDTDSVIATKKLTRNIGSDLGEWKFEGDGRNWTAIAPKVYRYDTDDKPIVKAKGIPDADDAWERIKAGAKVALDKGVYGLRRAARGDALFQRQNTTRQITEDARWCGARLRDGTTTRAPHVTELADLPR